MDASTFPITFTYHLIFSIVAGVFFLVQYLRLKRPYQLIFAIAIPASLLIYVDATSKVLFRTVGLFEVIMLAGAIVLSLLFRKDKKQPAAVPAYAAEEKPEETDA